MNQFVHVGANGEIVIDNPPSRNAPRERVAAYMKAVRKELSEEFAKEPRRRCREVNLKSGMRGGYFPTSSQAISYCLYEAHDRAKKHRAKQGRSSANR